MKTIFVIRHGETDFNKEGRYLGRTDEPLNAIGIDQAKTLAEKTSSLNIEIIYCSPLKRAVETAEFIKANHDCKVIIDKNFIERSIGIYEGLTKEEAKIKYSDLYAKNITRIFDDAPPKGETIDEVTKRVFIGLNEIKHQNKFSNILISTHGFIAKVINKYFNPQISDQEFFDFSLANAEIKTYNFDNLRLMDQKEIKKITDYTFLKSDPQKADLALVFGTRHQEAINKVYELYRDGLVSKILVSGGINRVTGENEALEMSNKLIQLGVKHNDIILEDKSTNSLENVLFSKQVIGEKIGFDKIKKIIAVVKHYHSRRAFMTFKKHFPNTVELIPVTYEIYGFTQENWFKNKVGREKVLDEWKKISEYLLKGDIEEI